MSDGGHTGVIRSDAIYRFGLQEERQSYQLMDQEDRPDFVPTAFDSLRQVLHLHVSFLLCSYAWYADRPPFSSSPRKMYQKTLNGR